MSVQGLVNKLKENEQDFEWYPTTDKMLNTIVKDIINANKYDYSYSLLDVGSGDGRVLFYLEKELKKEDKLIEKYAIEKSQILIDSYPDNVFVIGSDFYQQSFLDKDISIVFCNPPYSEYVEWIYKLLTELNCKYFYTIIPERWEENEKLKQIINDRNIEYEILLEDDFLNADRQARAKVHVVKFNIQYADDSFTVWFNSNFKIKANVMTMFKNKIKEKSWII